VLIERLLVEQLQRDLLFRWLVGFRMDDPMWYSISFTKKRDRLLHAGIALASSTRSPRRLESWAISRASRRRTLRQAATSSKSTFRARDHVALGQVAVPPGGTVRG
jgi:hypothetical protein